MGLGIVKESRKSAEKVATRFRASFRKRGTKRRVVVKPVGITTLKKITTARALKKQKKRQFGVFFFNKR